MRIVYIDIDSLRADHLGCYGYRRDTSPTVDKLATEGVRFDQCYISDAPCLPSRTAMTTGRFGIHTGVVGHGGTAADPFPHGPERGFNARPGFETWFQCLQKAGFYTASVSPFPQRHGGWWFVAGLNEWHNTGKNGNEDAHEVNAAALRWLEQHAEDDSWFLHVNYWDPHTRYTTPDTFGNPFKAEPAPDWYTEEVRRAHWDGYGPYSAQDLTFWFGKGQTRNGIPDQIASLDDYKAWIDGYDTGILYADRHLKQLLDVLEAKGVLDDTMIIVTADHGENQGELNVYGDHQTADLITCRVPFVVRYPKLFQGGQTDRALHYQFDLAVAVLELLGQDVPEGWDAASFASALKAGTEQGRDHLVVSQMAWACQRGVRFDHWHLMRTYHDGIKDFPDLMLFDAENDPHEEHNLASSELDVVHRGLGLLEAYHAKMMMASTAPQPLDPMQTVLREGGPFHTRGRLQAYLERLRATGRAEHAATLETRYR